MRLPAFLPSTAVGLSRPALSTRVSSARPTTRPRAFRPHAAPCMSAAPSPGRPKNAKETMARYGGSYLGSSIFLSLLSFAALYAAIDAGVDVKPGLRAFGDFLAGTPLGRPAALDKIGESGSTFALAYIAHKATSPIRFPPTLVLTEVIAKALGKDGGDEAADGSSE